MPLIRDSEAQGLRARAAAIRDEIAANERDLQAQREANERRAQEATALEAQARELDLEQQRGEKAAEFRGQADLAEQAAAELDEQAGRLNVEMAEAAIRAARFEEQLAGEVVGRRQELEQRSTQAAAIGDATAVLEAERDLALLPTLETRLREQADAAAARANELNEEAEAIDARAATHRSSAASLRRWADVDPLAPAEPAAVDELPGRPGLTRDLRRLCRREALQELKQTPDLHQQDPADVARSFEAQFESRRVQHVRERHARCVALLDDASTLVGRVRDAAVAEAAPNGSLRWYAAGSPQGAGIPRVFPGARGDLERAIAAYRASSGCGELPACTRLATGPSLEFVQEVVDAAASAVDELARERAALDGTLVAQCLEGPGSAPSSV